MRWWECFLCGKGFHHARALATHLDEMHSYQPLGRRD